VWVVGDGPAGTQLHAGHQLHAAGQRRQGSRVLPEGRRGWV